MSHDYVAYVLNSDLPKYMREVLRFSIDEVGLFSSLPFLLTWVVSIVSGFLCDHLINGRYLTTTQARKIFSALCTFSLKQIKEKRIDSIPFHIMNILFFFS